MIGLGKVLHFLSQNERNIKVHRMKIPDIIKLLSKHKEIKQDDLDNINIQIINTLNHINPNKIITNIIHNNVRVKKDLKSLKKKIYFNHLLLRTLIERNKSFKIYECKEDAHNNDGSQNETSIQLLEINTDPKNIYGRNKRKIKLTRGTKSTSTEKSISDNKKNELNSESQHILLNLGNNNTSMSDEKRGVEIFNLFELTNNYSSFILDNVLKHICSYIYNYKALNKVNKVENKGYEIVSVFLISNIFHSFFELKFGYTYIVHFLNGLQLYRIKDEINVSQMNFEIIHGYVNIGKDRGIVTIHGNSSSAPVNINEGENFLYEERQKSILEKVHDISFIIDYLNKNVERTIRHTCNRSGDHIPDKEKNVFVSDQDSDSYVFEDAKKKQTYIVNVKDKILLSYSINESYLNYFLDIIQNKYNVDKISFSNYCLLMHMYSMSNHFVINLFASLPLLFLKNKMHTNINTFIILLNSCIFLLRGKSFMSSLNSFHIFVNSDKSNKLIEDKNYVLEVKEKIYLLTEQLINYIFQNREIMNNNHLLQILEILSFIKYKKILFSYIFNKMRNSLCLLDKYQIFYFLNSMSNYDIIYNKAKNEIHLHTLKNMDQYSRTEIKQMEKYLQVKC
ncbi:hypothetical protein, conserved [Plasmodium gonderi]|uniref:Uncharacterized protein n=1 Tax=Plasmodium gonderi TaxID=77519 RepID=A0A1Y1JJY5_PLAGO|nr:hypothetical protein, conserved [Plasmodium gonderi]GAW81102.1 hypothetical protein, conserved [Plasmodium gonderi]